MSSPSLSYGKAPEVLNSQVGDVDLAASSPTYREG
jgi:hypothetical protein